MFGIEYKSIDWSDFEGGDGEAQAGTLETIGKGTQLGRVRGVE